MKTHLLLVAAAALSWACGPHDRQNSALCGITMVASGNRILDQLANVHAVFQEAPEELTAGPVALRVIGYGASFASGQLTDRGVVLTYEGEGFPVEPGFGIALVDDSSEVFRGVVVFEPTPPAYPEIGTIAHGTNTLPLFGLRIHWTSVNSEQCPLFAANDTSAS